MAQKQGKGKAAWTASRKARNEVNYRKGLERKAERHGKQLDREEANRANGWTPWQRAKDERAARRRLARQIRGAA